MSPNVGNFVHDLVEMAKAMETLPIIQSQLDDANQVIAEQGTVIAQREESILKLKDEIETLHARLRETEARADSAETMFLECDDKLSALRRLVESFSSNVGDLVKASEPEPIPTVNQPDPMPISGYPEPQDESAVGEPTSNASIQTAETPMASASDTVAHTEAATGVSLAPEVAPQPDPLQAHVPTEFPSPNGATDASETGATEPPPKPYAGYTWSGYRDEHGFVPATNRDEWEAGGGTIDNWYA